MIHRLDNLKVDTVEFSFTIASEDLSQALRDRLQLTDTNEQDVEVQGDVEHFNGDVIVGDRLHLYSKGINGNQLVARCHADDIIDIGTLADELDAAYPHSEYEADRDDYYDER
jgi:hypothetical protein